MEQVVDLNPLFPREFYKDMKKGYTITLEQCFENTSKYDVGEWCRFFEDHQYRYDRREMLEYFSETIVYLLDHGFKIIFKNGYQESNSIIRIQVQNGSQKEEYILGIYDLMTSANIKYSQDFKNWYIDFVLRNMELTRNYYHILQEVFPLSFPSE